MCGYFCTAFIDFMLAGRTLVDYNSLFSPHDFNKNDSIILSYIKEAWNWLNKVVRSNKIKIIWNKKIQNYFIDEINKKKSYREKLSKYVTAFDYIDKILIILSATTDGVSISSFISVIGSPVGIASASFTLVFFLTTGIMKKWLSTTRKKKKKHDQVLMLAESKLNSIETLISQASIDMDISHEAFIQFSRKKVDMRKWKKK